MTAKPRTPPTLAPLALSLAVLMTGMACSAVNSLPLIGQERAALPAATAPPAAAVLPAGPTIGTLRETRAAIEERVPAFEALAAEQYSDTDLTQVGATFQFTVNLAQEQPLLWVYGWCTTTPQLLEQNFSVIQLEFTLDGQPVDEGLFDVLESTAGTLPCRYYGLVLYDWPSGQTQLNTRVIYTEALYDGFGDYPAGEQNFAYTVNAP